jgi:hypothetical protein
MATDALSDVLRTVRLAGAVYFDVAARAPWVAEQPAREMVLPKILPGAGHLISYHVVTEGRCFAGIIGAEPIAVEAGEVIVFTKGDPHVMSSSPGMRANPVTPDAFDEAAASPLPFSVNYGGGGGGPPSVRLVCGFSCLQCPAVQSASRQPAGGHQGRKPAEQRVELARRVHSVGDQRIDEQARRR